VIVRPKVKTLTPLRWTLASLLPACCFMPIADLQVAPIAQAHGWHVILCQGAGETAELVGRLGATVTLNYFKDLMRRHLNHRLANDNWLDSISKDVAWWFGTAFRGGPAVRAANALILKPTCSRGEFAGQTDVFCDLDVTQTTLEQPLETGSDPVEPDWPEPEDDCPVFPLQD
jgi:hypothetical protein